MVETVLFAILITVAPVALVLAALAALGAAVAGLAAAVPRGLVRPNPS